MESALLGYAASHAAESRRTKTAHHSALPKKISRALANSARRFRFGRMANRSSISTADFAMPGEKPWTADTLVLIWSATKGLGAACLLHALQEHKIAIERRVAEFWPEFAQAGKDEITLAQLLSHQAGLAALDDKVDVLDYAAVIRALEKQKPLWPPGTAHGYHARTFGFLLDELIRRIALTSAGEYWRKILPILSASISGSVCRRSKIIVSRRCMRRRQVAKRHRRNFIATWPRPELRSQNFYFTGRFAFRQRDELRRDARVAFRFFRWDRQRVVAGEILRDARKRRPPRRSAILYANDDRLDDNHTRLRCGSRLPNSDRVFRRLHEGLARNIAKNFRTIIARVRPSRGRWQPRLRRSRK